MRPLALRAVPLLALILAGCPSPKPIEETPDGSTPITPTAPRVTSVSPAADATEVEPSSTVSVTFDREMDAASLDGVFTVDGVTGTQSYVAETHTLTFTPASAFALGTQLTAHVKGTAKSAEGVALGSDYTWSFTTRAGPPAPHVVSTSPADQATGIEPAALLTATFDADLDEASLAQNFTVSNSVTGTVTFDHTSHVATFTPDAPLSLSTQYTVTLAANVMGANGVALGQPYTWTFTTHGDITAPTVVSTSPTDGGVLSGAAPVVFTFSEPLEPATVNSQSLIVETGAGQAVAGTVTYGSSAFTATFAPQAAWTASGSYTARVTTAITDTSGNALAADYPLSFTGAPDTTPPRVLSSTPSPGATNVDPTQALTFTFSEALDPATVTSANIRLSGQPAGTVSWDATTNTATLTPSTQLGYSTTYTLVASNTKDVAGNTQSPSYTASFTTKADPNPPTVVSTSPSNGTNGVSPSLTRFYVTYSKNMGSQTGVTMTHTASGTFAAGSDTLTGAFYSSPKNYYWTFSNTPLIAGSTYTVTIPGTVVDSTGIAMGTDYTFSFTVTPDTTPPTVVSSTPADGEHLVATNTSLSFTFSEALDPTTVTSTAITLGGVTGTVALSGTKIITFTPSSALNPGVDYTATVSTQVKDLYGNALAAPYVSKFRTLPALAPISQPGASKHYEPAVAYNSAGDGLAVWRTDDGEKRHVYYSQYSLSTNSWSAPKPYADADYALRLVAVGTKFVLGYYAAYPGGVKMVAFDGTNWGTPATFSSTQSGNLVFAASNGTKAIVVTGRASDFWGIVYDAASNTFSAVQQLYFGGQNTYQFFDVDIASSPSGFLVTFQTSYGVASQKYENGTWSGVTHQSGGYPNIINAVQTASNGTGYAVAWTYRDSTTSDTWLKAIVYDGVSWSPVTTFVADKPSSFALASNGSGYAILFRNNATASATLRSTQFTGGFWSTPTDVATTALSTTDELIGLAGNSSGYLGAWLVNGLPVIADGSSSGFNAPQSMALTNQAQVTAVKSLSVDSDGSAIAVGVVSTTASGDQFDVKRYSAGIPQSTVNVIPATNPLLNVVFTHDNGVFEAIWSDAARIRERRLGGVANVVSSGSFAGAVSDEGAAFDASGNGLVAWTLYEAGTTNLYAASWNKATQSFSAPFLVAAGATYLIDVVSNGSKLLVIYSYTYGGGAYGGYQNLYVKSWQNGTLGSEVQAFTGYAYVTAVAAGGGAGFLIATSEGVPVSGAYPVRAITSPDGTTWTTTTLANLTTGVVQKPVAAVSATEFAVSYSTDVVVANSSFAFASKASAYPNSVTQLVSDGTTFAAAGPDATAGGKLLYGPAGGTWTTTNMPTTKKVYSAFLGYDGTQYLGWLSAYPAAVVGYSGGAWGLLQTPTNLAPNLMACTTGGCLLINGNATPGQMQAFRLTATTLSANPVVLNPATVPLTNQNIAGEIRTQNLVAAAGQFHLLYRGLDSSPGSVTRLYGVMGM